MTTAWLIVVLVGSATIVIKSIGPILLGGRELPPGISSLIGLLAPALLAALVAINTFGTSRSLVLFDERVLGVAAAGVAVWRRVPVILVVVIAATVTAVARIVL